MLKQIQKFTQSFSQDGRGATAIEYGLIAAIIGVGIVVAVTLVSGSLQDTFSGIASSFSSILAG